jgi:hypothetical protein
MRTDQLSAVKVVHRLLFNALLEIRSQGYDQRDKVVYHLADLFHNVVLEMENAAEGTATYEDVFHFLEERAREKGCEAWVQRNLERLKERPDGG